MRDLRVRQVLPFKAGLLGLVRGAEDLKSNFYALTDQQLMSIFCPSLMHSLSRGGCTPILHLSELRTSKPEMV